MATESEAQDREGKVGTFWAHLEDLRTMLIRCLLTAFAGMFICFPLAPWILTILKRPLHSVTTNPDIFLRTLDVTGGFMLAFKIALWCGLGMSAPFLLLFIGQFVFPGLTRRERRVIRQTLALAIALFTGGVLLGYFVALPSAVKIMYKMNEWLGVRAEWTITSYMVFAVQMLIGFGLIFELPAVLLVLGRLGLVTARQLNAARRYVIVGILIVAAIITPDPSVFTQLVMSIPLLVLYELCIVAIWMTERKRAAQGGA